MGYCQLNEGSGKKLQVNFTMRDLRYIITNMLINYVFRTWIPY
jgi:hypothetical protein